LSIFLNLIQKLPVDIEKQVIVHCFLKSGHEEMLIRIWNSTYLRDQDSAHKSKLLTSHNITIYPIWMEIIGNARFTLVFSALPKSCSSFDLFEDIPEGNGFFTGLIPRIKSDVYSVEIYTKKRSSNLNDLNSSNAIIYNQLNHF